MHSAIKLSFYGLITSCHTLICGGDEIKYLAKLIFFLSITLTANIGCAEQVITSGKVEKLIDEKLEIGASAVKIEEFLTENEIAFSFDDFSNRYQCIIRDPSPNKPKGYHSIVIYIYVDANKAFKSAEVRDSYTAL